MSTLTRPLAAILLCLTLPAPLMARDLVIGGGFADFSNTNSIDGPIASLEYSSDPFLTNGRFSLGWGGAVVVHDTGDIFVGVGLAGQYDLNPRWFVEGSVLPGAFVDNLAINNLGSTFEIRSTLGLGYRLDSGDAISVALTHKSNAGTAPINPGVNSVMLRWRHRF